ncbi:MAG: T9SS type A sorting domain-containing protein, partial [Bacteroidia bacterium]|nr:T9SS type A sorting domain-containing protein [Bacteroidia bacterium]MDW8335100.1 T9SS type A sorting domain-containing protein [Bacteroidia bacterium]
INISFNAPSGGAAVTGYQISIDGTGISLTTVNTSESINVSMLTSGEYVVRVRTLCGDQTAPDATKIFVKPAVDCSAIPFINSISITSTTATIRWPRLPNAQAYEVQYRLAGGTEFLTLTVNQTAASIQSALITGLAPATIYGVRVRALCPEGFVSAYSIERRFRTLANPTREAVELDFLRPVSDLTVYPNPTKGPVTLSFSCAEATRADVSVFNLLGTKVFEKTYETAQGQNEISPDLTGSPTGIYFVRLSVGEHAQTVRLVVE